MKISIITTGRADWNGLGMLAPALRDAGHAVSVIAVGEHGNPASATAHVVRSEWPDVIVSGCGEGSVGNRASDVLAMTAWRLEGRLEVEAPDMAVILGDRYEALCAATAATLAGVPIAHLDGGDETIGAMDNAMRDAITKLSHLHFVCHFDHAKRVGLMGENPDHVYVVGSTHADRVLATPLLGWEDTIGRIGLGGIDRFLIVNWQPETLATNPNGGLELILAGLADAGPAVLFVGQNSDPGGSEATEMIKFSIREQRRRRRRRRLRFVRNLKPLTYLSALSHCDCLIGNSSSAYFEAPYLGCWAIDVGDRQSGRRRGHLHSTMRLGTSASTMRLGTSASAIADLVSHFGQHSAPVSRPYGDGDACKRIVDVLDRVSDPKALLRKTFHRAG